MKRVRDFPFVVATLALALLAAYAAGFWLLLRPHGGLYRVRPDSFERVLVYELRDTVPNRALCAVYAPVIYCLGAQVQWR